MMLEANTVAELSKYTRRGPEMLAQLYDLIEKVNCNDYYKINVCYDLLIGISIIF